MPGNKTRNQTSKKPLPHFYVCLCGGYKVRNMKTGGIVYDPPRKGSRAACRVWLCNENKKGRCVA